MGTSIMRWWLLLPLSGCAFISEEHEAWRLDPDGDGVSLEEDCDNEDASVGAPLVWQLDLDGDGHGDPVQTVEACTRPDNGVTLADDCWDNPDEIPADFVALNGLPQPSAAEVYPGAPNALYDGVDQSCLGAAAFTAAVEFDADGDGYLAAGYADRGGTSGDDCIDGAENDAPNPAGLAADDVHPGVSEIWYDGTDADCDGNDCDADGDGYGGGEGSAYCTPVDCNDTDDTIRPDASVAEIFYNGIDDNCDLAADQDGDADGDGYWATDYTTQVKAAGGVPLPIPAGAAGDCWDDPGKTPTDFVVLNGFGALTAGGVSPAATERWWDGIDADCSGNDDFDADGDGYAYKDARYPNRAGEVGDDCYDSAGQPLSFQNLAGLEPALVNINAIEEYYDGTDANCDDNDDDQDVDGYPAEAAGGSDCDDLNQTVYPTAPVICFDDIQDNDCDNAPDAECELSDMDLSDAHIKITDKTTSEALGTETLWADLDGDGKDDAVVSAASADRVYVFGGLSPTTSALNTGSADALLSVSAGASLGKALLSADMDSDGYTDLWVGAPDSAYGASGAGALLLFYGPLSGTVTSADVYVYGRSSGAGLGTSVSLSIDGDLLVGAPEDSVGTTEGGAAYRFAGPISSNLSTSSADTILTGGDAYGRAGAGVAWVDLDGDGEDDALISAPDTTYSASDDGEVFVFYGPLSSVTTALINADVRLRGDGAYTHLGQRVVPVGDVNTDGYADVWVTSEVSSSGEVLGDGAAALVLGSASGPSTGLLDDVAAATVAASVSGERVGSALSGAGDLDDDGYADVLIGASERSSSTGAVYVFYGPLSGSLTSDDADLTFQGEARADAAGSALVAGGDANGDGVPDMLIAAPGEDSGASGAGAAYIVFGPRY